jgi:hypothetical protein
VYATLREELLSDQLLENQPKDARDWMKEVCVAPCAVSTRADAALWPAHQAGRM